MKLHIHSHVSVSVANQRSWVKSIKVELSSLGTDFLFFMYIFGHLFFYDQGSDFEDAV